jgi:hypothetical protein
MRKSLLLTGIVLGAGMMAATGAQAACSVSSQIVERTISYPTYCYVYFRPKGALTNTTYYYMRSTSDKICSLAGDAQTNRSEVSASGNTGSCPTSGIARYMGDANYLYVTN